MNVTLHEKNLLTLPQKVITPGSHRSLKRGNELTSSSKNLNSSYYRPYSTNHIRLSKRMRFFINFQWIYISPKERRSSLPSNKHTFILQPWIQMLMRQGFYEKAKTVFFKALLHFSKLDLHTSHYPIPPKKILTLISHFYSSMTPVFSFFVEKVSKKIRKFSRGKSGKYSVIWGYVKPHKRGKWVLKWLSKSVELEEGNSQKQRFISFLQRMKKQPQTLLINRVLTFVNSYVLKNLKKTLIASYKRVK